MFDTIICEHALPLPDLSEEEAKDFADIEWDEVEFQTKSFDDLMVTYTITDDGQIYEQKVNREWVLDEDHPLGGLLEEKDDGIEKSEHTGDVVFYHLLTGENYDYWLEFKFLFWKGDLKETELLEFKKDKNDQRKEAQGNFEKQIRFLEKRKKSWWFPFYKVYRYFFGFIFAIVRKILEWKLRVLFKIERWMP